MEILTGVININAAAWLWDEVFSKGTDLDAESHLCHCEGKDGYHDECFCVDIHQYIIGFEKCSPDDPDVWFREDGEFDSFAFKINESAEFSAIIGEIYAQIVRSDHIFFGAMCSPCYPNQVDLGNEGAIPGYCLPPELFDDDFDDFPVNKILKLPEIWDNGGKTVDRYTIFFEGEELCVGSSESPFHPQGFWQHSRGTPGKHLGKQIHFNDLPFDVRKAILQEMEA